MLNIYELHVHGKIGKDASSRLHIILSVIICNVFAPLGLLAGPFQMHRIQFALVSLPLLQLLRFLTSLRLASFTYSFLLFDLHKFRIIIFTYFSRLKENWRKLKKPCTAHTHCLSEKCEKKSARVIYRV